MLHRCATLPPQFFVSAFKHAHQRAGTKLIGNGGYTKANSVQVELRRRLSSGIAYSVNYTWGQDYVGNRYSFRTPRVSVR